MTKGRPLSAAWLLGLSQLRRRWRSWLGLAVLIGLAGGVVVGAAAGARRTSSAYDRLLEQANPFDVALGLQCPDEVDQPGCSALAQRWIRDIVALPQVADGGLAMNFLAPVLDHDGFSIQPQTETHDTSGEPPGQICFTGSGEVDVFGSPDGRIGTEINRHRFVSGRAANPARADEVVISVATAKRAGIEVGDPLRIVPVDACGDVAPAEWPPPFDVTVVGLHVAPGEVQPETGRYLQTVTVTPPLLAELAKQIDLRQWAAAVRLREGVAPQDLVDAVKAAGIQAELVLSQAENTDNVHRGLRPDALSLWLLALLGGLTALVVLSQAITRQVWAGADEIPVLRAIGFTARDLALAGGVEGAATGIVAGTVTAVLAVACSPFTPIGRARLAEPHPGVRVDALVVAAGATAAVLITLVVVIAVSNWVAASGRVAQRQRPQPSLVAAALGRLGMPPSASAGARMALTRSGGRRPVPVRSGLTAMAVGLAALIGSLTFSADLEHLLANPRLVGWNWDLAFLGQIDSTEPDSASVDSVEKLIERARGMEGVARAGYATFYPGEVPLIEELPEVWPLSFSTGPRSINPTVVSGRAPAGPEELLLTPSLLERLDLAVGDRLDVQGTALDATGVPAPRKSSVMVVGSGVFPIGDGNFEQVAALTFEGLRRLAPDVQPQLVLIDFADGADRARTTKALAALGLRGPLQSEGLDVPALVDLDVRQADSVPRLFGALMAVLSVGVLIHLVLTGVRARRHELATLRSLGFTRRQVRAAVAWQATILTAVPFAVAALIGAAAGRAVWLAYAERLSVAPATVLAWQPVLGFLVQFLMAANVVGLIAARTATRYQAAAALRTE